MIATSSDVRRRVDAALRGVLPSSVDVNIIGGRGDSSSSSDFLVTISGTALRVMWVRSAWLSIIEKILARIDPPDVLIADRVPPASRLALTEAGIGWVEASGAAEIAIDSLVVSRSARETRIGERPRSRWTPAAVGVAEAILAGIKPTVSATHEATSLSVGACTKALRMLTDIGLLQANTSRGPHSGRRVVDIDELLDAYVAAAHNLGSPPSLSVGVVWRDPIEGLIGIGDRWDAAGMAWVATGLAAAMVVAPLVTSVGSTEVYIDANDVTELVTAASVVGLRPIEGGRLSLASFPTVTTQHMATMANGLRVAPWPRLVADLRRSGVRGEEAAEHLTEIVRSG
ncbi:MAG: hypothetical protein ACE5M4_04075 [Anaerolineales bacterium]